MEEATSGDRAEVKDIISDGDTGARGRRRGRAEDSIRQVVNREGRVCRDGKKAQGRGRH